MTQNWSDAVMEYGSDGRPMECALASGTLGRPFLSASAGPAMRSITPSLHHSIAPAVRFRPERARLGLHLIRISASPAGRKKIAHRFIGGYHVRRGPSPARDERTLPS